MDRTLHFTLDARAVVHGALVLYLDNQTQEERKKSIANVKCVNEVSRTHNGATGIAKARLGQIRITRLVARVPNIENSSQDTARRVRHRHSIKMTCSIWLAVSRQRWFRLIERESATLRLQKVSVPKRGQQGHWDVFSGLGGR